MDRIVLVEDIGVVMESVACELLSLWMLALKYISWRSCATSLRSLSRIILSLLLRLLS